MEYGAWRNDHQEPLVTRQEAKGVPCASVRHNRHLPASLPPMRGLALLALVLPATAQDIKNLNGGCLSALDCVLNGDCVDGVCQCAEGWTGKNCQEVDLISADVLNGFGSPEYPTWGGISIYTEGKYHFIGSYMVNQCTLSQYGTNSAWGHAIGDTPMGPFTFHDQVLPPFHHGAQVGRYIDGSFYVVGDGENTPSTTWQVCNNGHRSLRSKHGGVGGGYGVYAYGHSPQDYHVAATSKSIYGPWTQHVLMQTNYQQIGSWSCNVTNLSPLILDNGTIIMSFRSRTCIPDAVQAATCGNMCQYIGLAVSTNGWEGPFIRQQNPIATLQGNEDPFFWQDTRGYHMLMHGKIVCGASGVNTCGSLGFSEDLVNWYLSPLPAYGATVQLSTGQTVTLALRQRPKILFNSDKVPMVLYNGGQVQGESFIRNLAFAFNTAAMRNYQPPPPCPPKPQFQNLCGSTDKGVPRTQTQCSALGSVNCVWCANNNKCMYGGSTQICTAVYPDRFYDYCLVAP